MDLSRFLQYGNMISELGVTAAKQSNDKEKIDTKAELNLFTSGWEAIQSKAKAEGADDMDMYNFEVQMRGEMAGLLGAEFGQTAGLELTEVDNFDEVGPETKMGFSQEEISLENMMSLLSDEDGIDIDKLREYNKKPMISEVDATDKLTNAGFSEELTDILMEETPGVVRYLTNSIKNGDMDRIEAKTRELEEKYGIDPDQQNIGAFMEMLLEEGFFKD